LRCFPLSSAMVLGRISDPRVVPALLEAFEAIEAAQDDLGGRSASSLAQAKDDRVVVPLMERLKTRLDVPADGYRCDGYVFLFSKPHDRWHVVCLINALSAFPSAIDPLAALCKRANAATPVGASSVWDGLRADSEFVQARAAIALAYNVRHYASELLSAMEKAGGYRGRGVNLLTRVRFSIRIVQVNTSGRCPDRRQFNSHSRHISVLGSLRLTRLVLCASPIESICLSRRLWIELRDILSPASEVR
jgi:hypothetical protein